MVAYYNITMMNPERSLLESRQHGKFSVAHPLKKFYIFRTILLKKCKTFSMLIFSYINTREN